MCGGYWRIVFSIRFRSDIYLSLWQQLYYCLDVEPVTMKHLLSDKTGRSPFCPAATVQWLCFYTCSTERWSSHSHFLAEGCRLSSKHLCHPSSVKTWQVPFLPAKEKHLHNRTLLSPGSTAEMMIKYTGFSPDILFWMTSNFFFVSSDHSTFFHFA